MLSDERMALDMDDAIPRYLHEVLGIAAPVLRPWAREPELPYFLRDAFTVLECDLLGQRVLLAIERNTHKPLLGEVRAQIGKVRDIAGQPVIYCTSALASYERRRLIEQKLPFMVPGNQLYLPDLGLDLREYFRSRGSAVAATLSPAAQAMLIAALLRQPWQAEWQPAALAAELGYTPMTLSRVVKELAASGIGAPFMRGRSRCLRMELSPRQTWEQVKPLLRTPVKRSIWVRSDMPTPTQPQLLAGLSALAHHSMLAAPKLPTYAIGPQLWQAMQAGTEVLPEAAPDACEWQLWSYKPALVSGSDTVDPLSLTLSLQDNPDERIQLALDALMEQLPW